MLKAIGRSCLLIVIATMLTPVVALASSSTNYKIQEDFVGNSGVVNSSSATLKSQQDAAGSIGSGDGSSASYSTKSGPSTTDDPTLSFIVNSTNANLGTLTTSTTATSTTTFSVLNYTSFGYVVQTVGNTPGNGAYHLAAINPAAVSSPGTEQFGINLMANSGFGAFPQQVPNSSFGFGTAAAGYNTANTYQYRNGDTIALASKSSGQTIYTISYVANISTSTPPGNYSGTQILLCTGTY